MVRFLFNWKKRRNIYFISIFNWKTLPPAKSSIRHILFLGSKDCEKRLYTLKTVENSWNEMSKIFRKIQMLHFFWYHIRRKNANNSGKLWQWCKHLRWRREIQCTVNIFLQKQKVKPREYSRDGSIFRFFYVFLFSMSNVKELTRFIWQKSLFSTAWSKFHDFVNVKVSFAEL